LKELLISDIESRIASVSTLHKNTIEERKKEWENLLIGSNDNKTLSISLNSVSGDKLSSGIYLLKTEIKGKTSVTKFNIQ